MPAPGTVGRIPAIKNTVTGALKILAKVWEIKVIVIADIKVARTVSAPACSLKRYASQPTAPTIPAQPRYFYGVSCRTANVKIAINAPNTRTIIRNSFPQLLQITPYRFPLQGLSMPLLKRPPKHEPHLKHNPPARYHGTHS